MSRSEGRDPERDRDWRLMEMTRPLLQPTPGHVGLQGSDLVLQPVGIGLRRLASFCITEASSADVEVMEREKKMMKMKRGKGRSLFDSLIASPCLSGFWVLREKCFIRD